MNLPPKIILPKHMLPITDIYRKCLQTDEFSPDLHPSLYTTPYSMAFLTCVNQNELSLKISDNWAKEFEKRDPGDRKKQEKYFRTFMEELEMVFE